jgi:predicted ATPase
VDFDQPPVVRVTADATRPLDPASWPMTVPAVAQLVRDGLDLPKGVTLLVGENGSGKSTLVEALAIAYGLSPEGGTAYGRHSTRPTESSLSETLRLQRGVGAARYGFFLRAETMHGWYTFSEDHQGPSFHEMSHGESFL